MADELQRRLLRTETWMAPKIASLYEVQLPDGRIKYNVQVRDAGRIKPFIDMIFGKLVQAEDFLDNKLLKKEGTE